MSKPTAAELEKLVYEEWGNMHHNASISSHYPDFQNEYEAHLFWDCLGDEVSSQIEYLVDWIEEEFGEKLTFYQYGRQGATIAPHEYERSVGGSGLGCLDGMKVPDGLGLEGYNELYRLLKLFRFINKYWRDNAAYVGEWWADMKEANEWQGQIGEHEGKTLRTVEVWR